MNENEAPDRFGPLHFVNEDTSPAWLTLRCRGHPRTEEVTITRLPKDLPESIEVDLAQLKAGDGGTCPHRCSKGGKSRPGTGQGPRRRHRYRQGR
ncbi:hypothetical protein ACE0DR_25845 [Azotobacter sp. CWF10]